MTEAETRDEYIDQQLATAGWGVVEGSRIHRDYPIMPGRIEGLGLHGKGCGFTVPRQATVLCSTMLGQHQTTEYAGKE